jgi:hypothetical protein
MINPLHFLLVIHHKDFKEIHTRAPGDPPKSNADRRGGYTTQLASGAPCFNVIVSGACQKLGDGHFDTDPTKEEMTNARRVD